MELVDTYNTAKQLFKLKNVRRTGWVNAGVSAPESVADHSWGTALLCLLFSEFYQVDTQRLLEIAVVHDAAEVITGDIPATEEHQRSRHHIKRKQRLEEDAISNLFSTPVVRPLKLLWEEYEAAKTRESLVVRDLNLIDMALQTLLYTIDDTNPEYSLLVFLESAERRLNLPESYRIIELIKQDFRKLPLR